MKTTQPKSVPDPFVLVIFGASGDLARRKLIPAVYSLFSERLLPERFAILGLARSEKTNDEFRAHLREGVQQHSRAAAPDERSWSRFASKVFYLCGEGAYREDFGPLREKLDEISAEWGAPVNCLYYMALPPDLFAPFAERLHRAGLLRGGGDGRPWSRVVIEKPYGRDLQSARALNARPARLIDEKALYRIDHYLGKETVQNILVFRFANGIFEPIWNHKYVDHVQITVSETLGVGTRGKYYDGAGALRDIVQNHMMHLLSLVAMEAPGTLDADSIRDEKVKVLQSLRALTPKCVSDEVVRAQYGPGEVDGEPVPGYLDEPGVAPESMTETYAALKLFVDNWRWAGVPFYLRTGKRLAARVTEILIHFHEVPRVLFNAPPFGPMPHNILALRIQPNEGISMRFQVKVPGIQMRIRPLKMDFSYARSFGSEPPEAYERLLLDAVLGDQTLFTRSDEVEAAWKFIAPILDVCSKRETARLPTYRAGSWGPKEADELIAADGHRWMLTRRDRAVKRPGGEDFFLE